jgi:IS5 family transposase
MFKILVLQTLHNLADDQLEYLNRDRLSFMRFLDLGLGDPVPNATTVWLFREALAKAGLVAKLFMLFIRRYAETDARAHDSQKLADVLDKSNTGAEVWADSAYRSAEIEAMLEAKGYKSRVHRRARRNRPLSAREQTGNTTRSRLRARVEHVFGHQHTSMGGTIVRTIGIVRARAKIGLMNLVYNISRLVQLERMAAAPA